MSAKYSLTGQRLWRVSPTPPGTDVSVSGPIAADGGGNAYVAIAYVPTTDTVAGFGDIVKYDAAGHDLWHTHVYPFPQNTLADPAGELYVTAGTSTSKYSAEGRRLWTHIYSAPQGVSGVLEGLLLDGSGDVYAYGFYEYTDYNRIGVTLEYSVDGDLVWHATWPGRQTRTYTTEYRAAFDPAGNLNVSGTRMDGAQSEAFALTYAR